MTVSVDRRFDLKPLAWIFVTIFALTFLTYYFRGLSPRLERGVECEANEAYPTDVNLRFESIRVIDALNLLAGFSCNELETDVPEYAVIRPNYSEVPWELVVQDICKNRNLKCWTANGTLYAKILPRD